MLGLMRRVSQPSWPLSPSTARLDEAQAREEVESIHSCFCPARIRLVGVQNLSLERYWIVERASEGIRTPNSGATSRCLNHLATPAASVRIYQHELQPAWCPLHRVRKVGLLW